MSVRTPRFLLIVLACALAWGLPAEAETAVSPLCAAGVAPAAEVAIGAPGAQPAQTTCGPCLLDFCPQVGVRCSFTGCGRNNCCDYSCVCDATCTNAGIPGNICFIPLLRCLAVDVYSLGPARAVR
jgi:hypothetical protein